MKLKAVSGIMLILLFIGMLTLAFNIQPVKSDWTWTETVYIKADGSIEPDIAPISSDDNITYTLTDNILGNVPDSQSAIVVERDNIIVDGAGYTVQGTGGSYSKGISLSGRGNVTIKNTHATKFYYGVHCYGSTDSKIENITATGNNYGIGLSWESNQNILLGNNATNNSIGIYIGNSNNNNVTSNTITDCGIGIRLYDSSNNILSGNIISSCGYGIELWAYGSYGNILSGNIVSLSGVDGIVLNGADNNTLSGNIVSSNGQYGITLMADNNTIYGNILINNSGSYWSSGIYFGWTRNNIISSNTIKNNSRGVFLYGEGENNQIFHNNFINNTNQFDVADEHIDVWDYGYPSGGNYWDDYTGVDANGDGIGDTPYIIDANNTDRYPLMHPWSSLPVHNINTGLGYVAIQEALDALETLDGHVIFVETGTYYENVVVNKTVSLVGENKETTVIDGGGTTKVVYVRADNVTISGFTIQNSGNYSSLPYDAAICVFYVDYCNISDNILTTNFMGIALLYSEGNTINDNYVTNTSAYGVDLWYSVSNVLRNNIVTNNGNGIVLYYSGNNTVSSNNITYNDDGGVRLFYSFNNTIIGNNIAVNNGGIESGYSQNNIILSNVIINNGVGIGGHEFCNYTIRDCIITNNWYAGICLDTHCNDNKIFNNNLTLNERGIFLVGNPTRNTIKGNNITKNNYGIHSKYPNDNIIYHNNFINNTYQAYSEASTNTWDDGYPSGGNYWSNYTGVDLNYDGIGDTPYVIDGDNQDNYPLMGMFSSFPISYQGEAYDVDVICNSTISSFQFDHENRIIDFAVSGSDGTIGFCRIVIPRALIESPYTILVDGQEIPYTELPISNITHAFLYFTYSQSTHHIKIFTSPPPSPPVGGKATPINTSIDDSELLTPHIGLAILLAIAVTTVVFVKKRKRNTETNS